MYSIRRALALPSAAPLLRCGAAAFSSAAAAPLPGGVSAADFPTLASSAAAAPLPGGVSAADFPTLAISVPSPGVVEVALNRPEKLNAFNRRMWRDLRIAIETLGGAPGVRAVVLSGGASKHFTAGLDLSDHAELVAPPGGGESEAARRG
jgi:enoyl-CoA hydratase/carnithine racemase